MRSKSGSRRMTTVEQANELTRQPLAALVRQREALHGSRMAAYDAVGTALGRSGSWVRKVIGRAPDVQVGLHDWLNINAICARLDAASERLEAHTAAREAQRAGREADAGAGPVRSGDPQGGEVADAAVNDGGSS